MGLKYDKPLIAAILGVISAIPYTIFTMALVSLGLGKYSVIQLSSLIVTLNRPTPILGAVITSVLAGIESIIFYYVIKKVGSNYLIIKSIGAGLASWVLIETVYTWLIEGPKIIPHRPVSDYYIELFGAVIFSISLGLLFRKYLFNEFIKSNI